ncbi:hypothetical protein NSTC731_02696 [Nostoc sp. DSM 114167]
MKFETLLLSEACFLAFRLSSSLGVKEKELINLLQKLLLQEGGKGFY